MPKFTMRFTPLILVAGIFLSNNALAQEGHFAFPFSASFGIGTIQNDDKGVPSRTMNSFSFEALPSYRFGQWMIGPHADYRLQEQLTSVSSAGGVNWRGQGYLVGLGARYDLGHRLFVQGSVDFIGEYDLQKNTSIGQDDNLHSPLGFRLKAGKSFFESLPNLSFDLDLQYLTYSKLRISGDDQSATSKQFMASVGLTCVIPCWSRHQDGAPVQTTPPQEPDVKAPVRESEQETLSKVLETKQAGSSLQLTLSGTNFDVGSSALTEEGLDKIAKVANSLNQMKGRIRIEGHTDSSGNLTKNMKLSEERARSVKDVLVKNGVASERIETSGFGPKKPIAPNTTKEGKAKNRRVEIFVETAEGK